MLYLVGGSRSLARNWVHGFRAGRNPSAASVPTRSRVLRAGTGTGFALGLVAAIQYLILEQPVDSCCRCGPGSQSRIGFLSAFLFWPCCRCWSGSWASSRTLPSSNMARTIALLDQLRKQAPGTWHHSVNVADLSEKAAAEIGARALFCKTAALYHDIGKLKEPAIFAENNEDLPCTINSIRWPVPKRSRTMSLTASNLPGSITCPRPLERLSLNTTEFLSSAFSTPRPPNRFPTAPGLRWIALLSAIRPCAFHSRIRHHRVGRCRRGCQSVFVPAGGCRDPCLRPQADRRSDFRRRTGTVPPHLVGPGENRVRVRQMAKRTESPSPRLPVRRPGNRGRRGGASQS